MPHFPLKQTYSEHTPLPPVTTIIIILGPYEISHSVNMLKFKRMGRNETWVMWAGRGFR